ncbi:hypothetical protein D3C79_981220 [compost metagenome]
MDVAEKNIHHPVITDDLFASNLYPQPIVDLSSSRQRALNAFKNLPTRQEERAVT